VVGRGEDDRQERAELVAVPLRRGALPVDRAISVDRPEVALTAVDVGFAALLASVVSAAIAFLWLRLFVLILTLTLIVIVILTLTLLPTT